MRRLLKWLLPAAACLLAPAAHAVKVPALYEAEVPVADQSNGARSHAISQALRAVLIKMTGSRAAAQSETLASLFLRPENLVQQFRYREIEAIPGAPVLGTGLRLWVGFDEGALNRALQENGVPIWDRERPATLLWLVAGDGAGGDWVTADRQAELFEATEAGAAGRGLVLIRPLLDLQDTANLGVDDVAVARKDRVREASARYQPDAVLAGTLEAAADGWQGRWTVYLGGEESSWTTTGADPGAAAAAGVDLLADFLAQRFMQGADGAEASEIQLVVRDVTSADHYARALQYLRSLNSVATVQVSGVEEGRVTFVLTTYGGDSAIAQAIALGRVLEPVANAGGHLYRLVP